MSIVNSTVVSSFITSEFDEIHRYTTVWYSRFNVPLDTL